MTDLGTLGSGYSSAWGINSAGQVTGYSYTADGEAHAFLYTGGNLTDLGTLGGTTSVANGINSAGQVAGYSSIADGDSHAFLYSGGNMTDIGTLGGSTSAAVGINDAGQVVGGASTLGNAASHAFLYSGGSMADLGTLGGTNSQASAINAAGQVVGQAQESSGRFEAFLYSNGSMTDLSSDLDSSGNGWTLLSANSINNNGMIVGTAANSTGAHAFLLTPLRTFTWTNGGTTGLWTTSANWSPDGGPGNAGDVVVYSAASPTGTVTLGGNQTVGTIQFANGGSNTGMTIAAGNPAGMLTLDSGIAGSTATINVSAGLHTISAPVVLNQSVGINITTIASGTGLTIGGPISDGPGGGSGIMLSGGGTLTISGANTYSGGTTTSPPASWPPRATWHARRRAHLDCRQRNGRTGRLDLGASAVDERRQLRLACGLQRRESNGRLHFRHGQHRGKRRPADGVSDRAELALDQRRHGDARPVRQRLDLESHRAEQQQCQR